MGAFGSWMDATLSAGSAKTSATDIGGEYDYLILLIPPMDEGKLWMEVAEATGSTYFRLGKDVTTNTEEFGRAAVWRLGGFQHIKIVRTNSTKAATLRIRGWRT